MSASKSSYSSDALVMAVHDFEAALTPTQKTEFHRVSQTTGDDTGAIIAFTAAIDSDNANRRGQCLSPRLFKVLQSVQDFSSIADTFVSAHPETAALVLGSLKFTIRVANNTLSYFVKLSECFMKIGSQCPIFSEYNLLYPSSEPLRMSLRNFYASIVKFCKKAFQINQQPAWLTYTKAVWVSFEKDFSPYQEEIEDQSNKVKEQIELAAQQAAFREQKAAAIERDSQQKDRGKMSVFRKKVSNSNKEAQDWRIQVDERRKQAEREELLNKISDHDYMSMLRRLRRKRYRTTGTWLCQSEEFREWERGTIPSTLWLSGILGSGKSIATTTVLDHLFQRRKGEEQMAFFFCEYNNEQTLTARAILGSLLRQCLSSGTNSAAVEAALESMSVNISFEIEDLGPLLYAVGQTSSMLTFILDGLDECQENERSLFLRLLHRYMDSKKMTIKLFISTREGVVGDISRLFQVSQGLKLTTNCEESRADIEAYVRGVVVEKVEEKELVVGNKELISDIQDALIKKAGNMFLWVYFQVSDLCRQTCDEDIRTTISTLPRDLPETYERRLSRIVSASHERLACKVFQWVAVARRPLSLAELRDVIAIEPVDEYFHRDRLVNDISRLFHWCEDLIVVEEQEVSVKFAHQSVKDFLLSKSKNSITKGFHFQLSDADYAAGEICTAYLTFNDFERQLVQTSNITTSVKPEHLISAVLIEATGRSKFSSSLAKIIGRRNSKVDIGPHLENFSGIKLSKQAEKDYFFLAYTQTHWLSHTQTLREGSPLWNRWMRLILENHGFIKVPWLNHGVLLLQELGTYAVESEHPALLAVYLRKVQVPDRTTRTTFESGEALTGSYSKNPVESDQIQASFYQYVRIAAIKGNIEILDKLLSVLEIEMDSKHPMRDELSPFQEAVRHGHSHIVRRLLEAGADVNARPSYNSGTALQIAARYGNLEVVNTLLKAGADVDAPPSYNSGTALQIAARYGNLEVVDTLLKAGADVDASPLSDSETALQTATIYRNLDMIESLLRDDLDIPSSFESGTVLQTAARYGNLEVVDRLLKAGANPNEPPSNQYGTALQTAVKYLNLEVVDRLLKAGANVDAPPSFYAGTALQTARIYGNLDVVNRLLKAGADANKPHSNQDGTALQIAARYGNLEVVDRLLRAGADVDAPPSYNSGTALQIAARYGNLEVLDGLLKAGANVDAPPSFYSGTAIQTATIYRNFDVLDRLLKARADANEPHAN